MFNSENLKFISNGEKEVEAELLLLLKQAGEKFLTAAHVAVERGDAIAWKTLVHEFKGGTGSLGADNIFDLCEEAERNQNPEERPILLARFEKEVKALIVYINDYLK